MKEEKSVEEKELHSLVKEAHELAMLKRLFQEKLNRYSGITRDELESICIMIGFRKEVEIE